jgi:hypothetical protein
MAPSSRRIVARMRACYLLAPGRECECWTGTSHQPHRAPQRRAQRRSHTPHNTMFCSGGLGVVAGCHGGGLMSNVIPVSRFETSQRVAMAFRFWE